jgi:hypothetical protein
MKIYNITKFILIKITFFFGKEAGLQSSVQKDPG